MCLSQRMLLLWCPSLLFVKLNSGCIAIKWNSHLLSYLNYSQILSFWTLALTTWWLWKVCGGWDSSNNSMCAGTSWPKSERIQLCSENTHLLCWNWTPDTILGTGCVLWSNRKNNSKYSRLNLSNSNTMYMLRIYMLKIWIWVYVSNYTTESGLKL